MFLRDAYQQPIPPTDIVSALKRVDDRLDLKYVAFTSRDGPNINGSEYWAIIQRWTQDDARRRIIALGQMAPDSDFDVMTYLPLDCPVEDAYNYFQRAVEGQVRDKRDVTRIASRISNWNEAAKVEVLKETTELAEDLIETNAKSLFRDQGKTTTKVYQK